MPVIPSAADDVVRNARRSLAVAAVAFVLLPMIPVVNLALRPFTYLQTFAHELGHGLTAAVLGGGMFTLEVYADGSGVTHYPLAVPDVAAGLVSIGGLVGPAFAAAAFFVAARRRQLSRAFLVAFGLVCAASAVVVVDNLFGRVVVGAWAAVLLVLGARLTPARCQLAAAFAGVDVGLSVFSRGDYLFTGTAHTAGGDLPSDVANVATALGGFYLVWGLAIGVASVAVVAVGLIFLLRGGGGGAPLSGRAPGAKQR